MIIALTACTPESHPFGSQSISYPGDEQISSALEAQLVNDPHSAAARELIQSLGGDKGKLRYTIHRVISRGGGSFEAHYDAVLVMGQPGEQSLQALYARMIPDDEKAKLPDASLAAYSGWLNKHAETLKKNSAQQAQGQALSDTLASLTKCYGEAKPGSEVVVMNGLGALLLPERRGLYAEKLAMPNTEIRCLPA
ncbi:hypothetical protein G7048_06605 [Diaphorobacter sp. HDW4B]|nr:hypothetical protein G7048_06605 [Diaphorobacter sp. HDW4B]